MHARTKSDRRARRENGTPVLIVLALLATLPAIGLLSPRSRRAAEPSSETTHQEYEPPPSPLVAPRPPADGARSSAEPVAREPAREAEDAEPASARSASTEHPLELVALEVRVRAAGRPAAAAEVELLHEPAGGARDAPPLRRRERCDEQGRVRLELAPGTVRAVAWSADATAPPAGATLRAGAAAELELALEPAFPVEGRVIDAASGAPLAGARVSFWTFAESDAVETGPDGSFVHPRFPARAPSQQIAARAPGHGLCVRYLRVNADGSWKLSGATAGEKSAGGLGRPWIELALVPEQCVAGRVQDEHGAPLAGARVVVEGFFHALASVASRDALETESGADGSFRLTGLRSDIGHALVIEAAGRARARLELAAGASALDVGAIELARESVLAGVVIDAAGLPLAGVDVVLRVEGAAASAALGSALDAGARLIGRELHACTGPEGTFLFEHLEPTGVTLSIQHEFGRFEQEFEPRADGSFPAPCVQLLPAAFAQR